jgi:hypothetical protein
LTAVEPKIFSLSWRENLARAVSMEIILGDVPSGLDAQRFGMRQYKGRTCRIVDAITLIGQGSSSTFYAPTSHGEKVSTRILKDLPKVASHGFVVDLATQV